MSSVLKTHKSGAILHVVFEDETSRNAFSIRAARELRAIIHKKDFGALIFSARGRVFCSGGNLADYAAMSDADQGRRVNDEIREVLNELASLDRPTIAAVNGDAFGGGVELLSAFDLIIAAPHAMFALWQRKIGLIYGWGGGARLEKRLGATLLKRLSLTTAAFTARDAQKFRLVDQVVAESELVAAAEREAMRMSALPAEPFQTLKNFSPESEAKDFNQLWWNESHKKTLAARKR